MIVKGDAVTALCALCGRWYAWRLCSYCGRPCCPIHRRVPDGEAICTHCQNRSAEARRLW